MLVYVERISLINNLFDIKIQYFFVKKSDKIVAKLDATHGFSQ